MRDIILALIVFGTIPFILKSPFVGLMVWSWLDYMNPHRLTYGFAYGFPWVMLIAVVTFIGLAVSKERKNIQWSSTTVLLVVFFLWITMSTFFAVEHDSAWLQWQQFGKTLIMVFVTLMLVKDQKRMYWLIWVIVVSLGFYGLRGGIFTVATGGAYHVFGPPASFIANNNDLAMALCMTLPLIRYLQLHAGRKIVRIGLGAALAFTIIAILGTYSRGGVVALVFVGAALFLKGRKRIPVALMVVVVGFAAYHYMPAQWTERMGTLKHAEDTDSAQTRIESWTFAANVALHRPLVGGGFNLYESPSMWARYAPEGSVRRAVHSIYFRVLGEQGFVGLGLFLALLATSWRCCSKVRQFARGSPEFKWAFDLALMLQISLLGYMVAGAAKANAYFDLSYQLMAMCVLLKAIVEQGVAQASTARGINAPRSSLRKAEIMVSSRR